MQRTINENGLKLKCTICFHCVHKICIKSHTHTPNAIFIASVVKYIGIHSKENTLDGKCKSAGKRNWVHYVYVCVLCIFISATVPFTRFFPVRFTASDKNPTNVQWKLFPTMQFCGSLLSQNNTNLSAKWQQIMLNLQRNKIEFQIDWNLSKISLIYESSIHVRMNSTFDSIPVLFFKQNSISILAQKSRGANFIYLNYALVWKQS